jgi:hypothetical protein
VAVLRADELLDLRALLEIQALGRAHREQPSSAIPTLPRSMKGWLHGLAAIFD